MFVSLDWLREYLDIPTDINIGEFADRITAASAEVEGIRALGADWGELITVGQVLEINSHPDADKLRLATVDHGADTPSTVVCGAPNLAVDQKIAFAQEGAMVTNPANGQLTKLKKAKIRGIESSGMVLSEAELGLSEAHDGILVLDESAPIGKTLKNHLGDIILDVHVWPNRPDMMSMLGIAREIGTILDLPLAEPALTIPEENNSLGGDPVIKIADTDDCRRYSGIIIENLYNGPSPKWLQTRLNAAGVRSINSIVDITNYVMMEIGQPLHAFDLNSLQGAIEIRRAKNTEQIVTIDGETHKLDEEVLVIADSSGPIALAGVMGGAKTEVTESTTSILLEAAHFNPALIRRSAQRFNLHSEASRRFERGLSPDLVEHAAHRALNLYQVICGGAQNSNFVDEYSKPPTLPSIAITPQDIERVLGISIESNEITRILDSLGYALDEQNDCFEVVPPSWRTDIEIMEDIAEDIVRLIGYDNLPAEPIAGPIPLWESDDSQRQDKIIHSFCQAGFQEIISYSLTTAEQLSKVLPDGHLENYPPMSLQYPLSSERAVLRTSLRHSLLETASQQLKEDTRQVAIFEMAPIYLKNKSDHHTEKQMLCAAVLGHELDRWGQPTDITFDFFRAKGLLDSALAGLRLDYKYVETSNSDTSAEITYGFSNSILVCHKGEPFGVIGDVRADIANEFGIEIPVTLIEIDTAVLIQALDERNIPHIGGNTPVVEHDISVIVDKATPANNLIEIIESAPLVKRVEIFDIYEGEPFNENEKSVSVRIQWQAPDRTLTGGEVQKFLAKILKNIKQQTGGIMRT